MKRKKILFRGTGDGDKEDKGYSFFNGFNVFEKSSGGGLRGDRGDRR